MTDIFAPITREDWEARLAFYRESVERNRAVGSNDVADYWENVANQLEAWLNDQIGTLPGCVPIAPH
jgi:hypothetical protein